MTGEVNKSNKLSIVGLTVSLGKRLTWPDDYFTMQQALRFQIYNLNNYGMRIGQETLRQGTLNNI